MKTKNKKLLLIAGAVFTIASASLFSISLAKSRNNDYYNQPNKYSFLNNQKLLESLFTNLNFNRNDYQNNFEFNNNFKSQTNNSYKDQKFINANKWNNNFEALANKLDDTYNKNPFGDYKADVFNTTYESDLNIPSELKKYVNKIDPGSPYHIPDPDPNGGPGWQGWTTGTINQTIKKENYRLHWINRYKFSSLTKDYDIKINKFKNTISYSNRDRDNKFIDKKAKFTKHNEYATFYDRFHLQCNDKIDVNFSLTKWNKLALDDAYELIKYFTKLNSFNHLKTFLEAFNLKNINQRITLESDTMGDLSTPIDTNTFIGGKSNLDKLKSMISSLEKTAEFGNFKLKYGYDVKVNQDGKSFNLIFKVKQIIYNGQDITEEFKKSIAK